VRQAPGRSVALGLAVAAWLVGIAIALNDGYYSRGGLILVTLALVVAAAVTLWRRFPTIESRSPRAAIVFVASALFVEVVWLVIDAAVARWAIVLLGGSALLQALDLGRLRKPLLAFTLLLFCGVAAFVIETSVKSPHIDVYVFQQIAAGGLLHGENPYAPRYPNLYAPDTPFYGPGVVDADGHLTVGLPYPPVSLLLALPGYLLGGDCRLAEIVAVAASAWLMAMSGLSRWTATTAMLFLLTPQVLFVIGQSWTETFFVFTLSLVMYCAMRWRLALPYALGVFFGTQQYSVLAAPLLVLLLDPLERWTAVFPMFAKAALVAALVAAPFFFWDPYAFWRSIVQFQFMQPLRMDALSHLVWMRARLGSFPLLLWIGFIGIVPAMVLALRRCERSPAFFAGAFALVNLIFFVFNKQAFSNYYYFIVGATAWAAVAAGAAVDG
jgi:hypothetical protein